MPTETPSQHGPCTHEADRRRFSISVRVYYEDTDVAGVVYYANYLRFIERARTEWLRDAGFELAQIQNELAAVFVVRRVEADYHRPARLGDLLSVSCEPIEVGRERLIVRQRVEKNGELLFAAVVTLAYIAADLSGPRAMPPAMRAAMLERSETEKVLKQ